LFFSMAGSWPHCAVGGGGGDGHPATANKTKKASTRIADPPCKDKQVATQPPSPTASDMTLR
jgi:hypothetical protein